MSNAWWIAGIAAVVLTLAALWWRPARRKTVRTAPLGQAKRRFHAQRERLEAKFLQLAAARAAADSPRWGDCSFADDVAYVRSRITGELSAFVAVTVAADPSDAALGGGLDAEDGLQAGTAVFRFDRDHWDTDGRAILNLSPSEAVRYYRDQLEMVSEEFAHHS